MDSSRERVGSLDELKKELRVFETSLFAFYSASILMVLLFAVSAYVATAPRADLTASHAAAPAGNMLLHTFSILVGSALASFSVGAMLGFLFGIPRILRDAGALGTAVSPPVVAGAPAAPQIAPRRALFGGNTNLEEISDWLTKIIIGIGIVEARELYEGFIALCLSFRDDAMNGLAGSEFAFGFLVITSLCCGFFILYLETRTRVPVILTQGESATLSALKELENVPLEKTKERVRNLSEEASQDGQAMARPTESDRKIAEVPFEKLKDVKDLINWGVSKAREGSAEEAARAFESALERKDSSWSEEDKKHIRVALADMLRRTNQPARAKEIVDDMSVRFPRDTKLMRDRIFFSLYTPQTGGYEESLRLIDELKQIEPDSEREPMIQVWRASANGLKYRRVSGEEAAHCRNEALDAVRKVIEYSPGRNSKPRKRVREMYDPLKYSGPPGDNDLEVFKGDEEFERAIERSERDP